MHAKVTIKGYELNFVLSHLWLVSDYYYKLNKKNCYSSWIMSSNSGVFWPFRWILIALFDD